MGMRTRRGAMIGIIIASIYIHLCVDGGWMDGCVDGIDVI